MKEGTRVRYIHEDNEFDKRTGFYPPIGTLGTIEKIDDRNQYGKQALVQWDSGTIGDGKWWCYCADVEKVEGEN